MNQLYALQLYEKYTLVKMGDMGFCFSIQFELIERRPEPWAQYAETMLLIYKEKRKKNLRQIRLLERDDFLIYKGWVEVNTEMFVEEDKNGPFTVRKSLMSCDVEYLYRAKRSVSIPPLVERISEDAIERSNRNRKI